MLVLNHLHQGGLGGIQRVRIGSAITKDRWWVDLLGSSAIEVFKGSSLWLALDGVICHLSQIHIDLLGNLAVTSDSSAAA